MQDKPLSIHITTGTIIKAVLVLVGVYAAYILSDLILALLTAIVIASAIEPATKWFARYRVPRVPAVLFVYVVAIAGLVSIIYFFIPPLLSQMTAFVSQLPTYLESLNLGNFIDAEPVTARNIGSDIAGLQFADILSDLRAAASQLSGGVLHTLSAVFGGVASFVLIIVFSFYLSVQERGIEQFLRVVVPVEHEDYAVGLWNRSQAKIGRWMQGQLVLVFIIGVLTFLGLTILGIEQAFLLAVIAGMTELIPLFGPIIAGIPAVAIAAAQGGWQLAVLVIGLYLVIQQFENHLIYPLVVRKVVGVPGLLVIIALIVGAQLAGFLGILLSVPAAAVLQELAADIEADKRAQLAKRTESGA